MCLRAGRGSGLINDVHRIIQSARTIEIPDNSDPNDGWSMINSTTEDIITEDIAAADTALAVNPTDNSVANQSDILMAAAEPTISNEKIGSVSRSKSEIHG
jgi:hypothetical protein